MTRFLTFFFAAMASLAFAGLALAQDAAQPTLETSPLRIVTSEGDLAYTVELANDPDEIRTGMMFRTEMAPDAGMLFDLGTPRPASFWMKNTLIPLDLLFIDETGQILAVAENAVPGSLRQIAPGVTVKAVLEINGGQASERGIAPGDQIDHALFRSDDAG